LASSATNRGSFWKKKGEQRNNNNGGGGEKEMVMVAHQRKEKKKKEKRKSNQHSQNRGPVAKNIKTGVWGGFFLTGVQQKERIGNLPALGLVKVLRKFIMSESEKLTSVTLLRRKFKWEKNKSPATGGVPVIQKLKNRKEL